MVEVLAGLVAAVLGKGLGAAALGHGLGAAALGPAMGITTGLTVGGLAVGLLGNLLAVIPEEPLDPVVNRTTNVTRRAYEAQIGGSCYAHSAASAYINTCSRIYGLGTPLPSYDECVTVADYNKGEGGFVSTAIERLEEHFHCGVQCETSRERPPISSILSLSVVVLFATSKDGWKKIQQGELLERPSGQQEGRHASLVEAYDLENDWSIAKNSWGHRDGTSERFKMRFAALHDFCVITVFFTLNSIRGKTTKPFHAQMETFQGTLDGHAILCAYMDEDTAKYTTNFICELHSPGKWIGFDLETWISIKLRRAQT
jgi:hypothetical protein